MSNERKNKPSASALSRLALCPGSWLMSQNAPTQPESDVCSLGTELHRCMETGETPTDPQLADTLSWVRDTELKLTNELIGPARIERETRLWSPDNSWSGQPDYVALNADLTEALIIDYKFGYNPVEPADANLQLSALAVLLKNRYSTLVRVTTCILQPFVTRSYSLCEFDVQTLEKAALFINNVVDKATSPGQPCKPSATACRYCPAFSTCPAVSLTINTIPSAVDLETNWQSFSPERKRLAFNLATLAKKWAAQVETLIKADLLASEPIPGLELAKGRQSTKLTDPATAFSRLNAEFPDHVTPTAFTACCNVSIPQLAKLVYEAMNATGLKVSAKKSREALDATLADITETSTSSPSIKVSFGD